VERDTHDIRANAPQIKEIPMRSFALLVLAAVAVTAQARPAAAQVGSVSAPGLEACDWGLVGHFPHLVPQALATNDDGDLLLAADDYRDPLHPSLVVLHSDDRGRSWELADRFQPAGSTATGARGLYADGDGNAFLLAWQQTGNSTRLLLRRSFAGGRAGSWESGEASWPLAVGGAITGSPDGRVYVAYGLGGGAQGIGWRVESALRGVGAFAVEDEFRPTGGRVYSAHPEDIERSANGDLVVAGQLDGDPDEWVVRLRPGRAKVVPWRTIDRFRIADDAQGLVPRAVVALGGGKVMAAGAGAAGSDGSYRWIERWRGGGGTAWSTLEYQRTRGLNTLAHDAVSTSAGVAVLGVAASDRGMVLVMREGAADGSRRRTVLELPGVTHLWSARLATFGRLVYAAATIEGAGVVIGCTER
jgi:hypothetical protein